MRTAILYALIFIIVTTFGTAMYWMGHENYVATCHKAQVDLADECFRSTAKICLAVMADYCKNTKHWEIDGKTYLCQEQSGRWQYEKQKRALAYGYDNVD